MIEPYLLEKYNYSTRFQKARKIEQILLDFLGEREIESLSCLDLGCSIGIISTHLADIFGQVIGIDPLLEAIDIARRLGSGTKVKFIHGDGLDLPFKDKVFDVIICAQVYEHSQNPFQLVREIQRVLVPGGCCFFSGPNRLWPIEYHYGWCCLHWLPRAFIHQYCQCRHNHVYDLLLFNYWQLQTLWDGFECYDYTLWLIYNSDQIFNHLNLLKWIRFIPRSIVSLFKFLSPNFNWILLKKQRPSA
jgi:ubiquinone/menaquinone biosynthesis C-methylase UbiE